MATRAKTHRSPATTGTPTRCVACEWGGSPWRLGCTIGAAPRPRERPVPAGAVDTGLVEMDRATPRFGLPAQTRVVSGYEAGRQGWWRHRFLVAQGAENLVVDAASLEVTRRQRRAKMDRLDVPKRLRMWRR
jgi:transposase